MEIKYDKLWNILQEKGISKTELVLYPVRNNSLRL